MSSHFLFGFGERALIGLRDILLLYVASESFDEAEFRGDVDEQIDRELVPDELVVLTRLPLAQCIVDAFASSPTLAALKRRIGPTRCVSVRAFSSEGQLVRTEIVHGASDIKSLSLPVLVRRAITKIVRDRNGFVIAGGNYHFQLPSEKHTDRFLRISNILVDFAEISFIAIGLLPFVSREVSTAYVDTSSLFPVVSAVSDHLRSFDKSRARLFGENFRSYAGLAASKFAVNDRSVVIISTSSSG